jgi:hypothetical protein
MLPLAIIKARLRARREYGRRIGSTDDLSSYSCFMDGYHRRIKLEHQGIVLGS